MKLPELRKRDGKARARIGRLAGVVFGLACVAGAASWAMTGCSGWDPREPFERNAPEVDEAIRDLDAGRFENAEATLEHYLGTGVCGDAGIGLPDSVRQKPNGSFDLGLALFHIAERYGQRFGEEDQAEGSAEEERLATLRSTSVDCALIIVKAIAADPSVPIDLRARARYLAGNLQFLRSRYKDAVAEYDDALKLVPGVSEEAGGDGIGRDAAHNRAIALRRIEDQKDAGQDAPDSSDTQDASDDASDAAEDAPDSNDGSPDSASPDASDNGDAGDDGSSPQNDTPDGGEDAGGEDGGQDGGAPDAQAPEPEAQNEPPKTNDAEQDNRVLDQLEEAPTYQEQEAKARGRTRRGRVLEDK